MSIVIIGGHDRMVRCTLTEAEKNNADVVRCHTSSGNALVEILNEKCL